MKISPWFILLICISLYGCQDNPSMFNSAGAEADAVIKVWWVLFGVAAFVLTGVTVFLFLGYFRTRKSGLRPDEKRLAQGVALASALTVLLLIFIIVMTFKYTQPLKDMERPAVTIEVVGKRWWWKVSYLDEKGRPLLTTANELHVPINRPVLLKLKTDNVIHSFWVPNLAGKVDMVPGRTNELMIKATKEGTFRGQCAEFCGIQHTFMAFNVIVSTQEKFNEWLRVESLPAIVPQDNLALKGQAVFNEAKCVHCHSIRGTFQSPHDHGPDLTHLAGRSTLAAGTVANQKGHLAGWITDPQGIKPGNLMPATPLTSEDLDALLIYLENLR